MSAEQLKEAIVKAESEMGVDHFTVSASMRNGFSPGKDSFISLSIKKEGLDLNKLPLYVLVAERKVALLLLLDAMVKGIITEADMKQARSIQIAAYDKLVQQVLDSGPKT